MKAVDAANYIVYLMRDVCEDLSNMKINKLLYYAQGYYLQKYGDVMFDDPIEAWEHGPVVPDVYRRYKACGDAPVSECDESRAAIVPPEAADILFEVARQYGRYTASALRSMTHVIGGPWDQVYRNKARHLEITVPVIRQYFQNIAPLERLELTLSDEDFVGYRDSEDVLVLPREWNDEAV